MMMADPRNDIGEGLEFAQDLSADHRMFIHGLPFAFIQMTLLGQDVFPYPYLAEIVELSGDFEHCDELGTEIHVPGGQYSVFCHSLGVAVSIRILCVNGRGKSPQGRKQKISKLLIQLHCVEDRGSLAGQRKGEPQLSVTDHPLFLPPEYEEPFPEVPKPEGDNEKITRIGRNLNIPEPGSQYERGALATADHFQKRGSRA